MAVTLPLETMSTQEKIQLMESIWEDLCSRADTFSSPAWHEKVLDEREVAVKRGEDNFVDWDTAKNNITNDISED